MFAPLLHYLDDVSRKKLENSHVGIAGAGGLGSNCAVMLIRSGIGKVTIIDGDVVEEKNLNRQHYFPKHIGMPKVEALAEQLSDLAPEATITPISLWLNEENIHRIIKKADVWVEAMDNAQSKAMFVSAALHARKTVIAGSGMAGIGSSLMRRRKLCPSSGGMLVAVGDFKTDISQHPPLAPRVMQCAAMQADAALEWLLTGTIKILN